MHMRARSTHCVSSQSFRSMRVRPNASYPPCSSVLGSLARSRGPWRGHTVNHVPQHYGEHGRHGPGHGYGHPLLPGLRRWRQEAGMCTCRAIGWSVRPWIKKLLPCEGIGVSKGVGGRGEGKGGVHSNGSYLRRLAGSTCVPCLAGRHPAAAVHGDYVCHLDPDHLPVVLRRAAPAPRGPEP